MGYRAMTFSTHTTNGRGTFLEDIYTGQILFCSLFMRYFFTLDTICTDNKGEPIAGCKNQSIKNCLRNF